MKFRNLRKKVATLSVISSLGVLCFGYQNCSRATFSMDEAAKAKVLSETPVFGEQDPGLDPGADPVTETPREPGSDPVVDPAPTATPTPSPTVSPSPSPSSSPAPEVPPVTVPPRDSSTDPRAPKSWLDVDFICPDSDQELAQGGAYKTLISSAELKAVFVKTQFKTNGTSVCEVLDIREQLLKNKRVDVSSCINNDTMMAQVYIVEKTVTSNYAKFDITMNDNMFAPGIPIRIAFTKSDDKANRAACDILGDPLVVQLANNGKPQQISLTSAEEGVMFDLLGKKNNYQKVQTAWFADNKTENYFLVLPDSKGQVNGIDQLFGDNTVGPNPNKEFAKQGFEALAKHDENRDRVISIEDSVFLNLRLWKDENLDGLAQAGELHTLEEKGVVAIDIKIDRKERRYQETDIHGNMTKYKSVVLMKDGQLGLVYDLWLRYLGK